MKNLMLGRNRPRAQKRHKAGYHKTHRKERILRPSKWTERNRRDSKTEREEGRIRGGMEGRNKKWSARGGEVGTKEWAARRKRKRRSGRRERSGNK